MLVLSYFFMLVVIFVLVMAFTPIANVRCLGVIVAVSMFVFAPLLIPIALLMR